MFFGARVQKAPMDVFPEFAPPRVEIQTLAIGLSAAEVEQLVTVPLEEQLNESTTSRPFVRNRSATCRRSK
jgi:Cu/Ag efflux pump CusA